VSGGKDAFFYISSRGVGREHIGDISYVVRERGEPQGTQDCDFLVQREGSGQFFRREGGKRTRGAKGTTPIAASLIFERGKEKKFSIRKRRKGQMTLDQKGRKMVEFPRGGKGGKEKT